MGTHTIKISVIIPVYNTAAFLAQCLENVVYQTYKNLEIIIVDDGTPDAAADIYNRYAEHDARIKVIKQVNQGLSAARNTGVAAATGDYIHYLDSDDYIDLEYYEKMVAAVQDTDADVACSGFEFQRIPIRSVAYPNRLIITTPLDKAMLTRGVYCTYCWRYLFRRQMLERISLSFEQGKLFEDIMYTIPALYHANKVVLVPDVLYHYRYNENSILTTPDPEKVKARKARSRDAHDAGRKFFADHGIDIKSLHEELQTSYRLFNCLPLMVARTSMRNPENLRTKYYLLGLIPIFARVRKYRSSIEKGS